MKNHLFYKQFNNVSTTNATALNALDSLWLKICSEQWRVLNSLRFYFTSIYLLLFIKMKSVNKPQVKFSPDWSVDVVYFKPLISISLCPLYIRPLIFKYLFYFISKLSISFKKPLTEKRPRLWVCLQSPNCGNEGAPCQRFS